MQSTFYISFHLAGLMETYVERGLLYLGLNRHIDALQDCQTGLRLATELSHIEYRSKACECLYQVFKEIGDADAALKYYEKYVVLRDSIFNAENIKQLAQLEMQYEFDRERDRSEERRVGKGG